MSECTQSIGKINLLINSCTLITSGVNSLSSDFNINDEKLKKSGKSFDEHERMLKNLQYKLQHIFKSISTNNDVNVIFIGSISSGKSKIINALINKNILKSAAGDITQTFIKISKDKRNLRSIHIPGKNVKEFITDNEMKNYLEDNLVYRYNNASTVNEVTILLPSRNNPILMDNVFLYDSPGLGKRKDSTLIIKEKCQIADILVFVITHNITMEGMLIFDELRQFTSVIPTIVLINKWDETDQDDESDLYTMMKMIETQITKRIISKIQVDIREYVFYVSAKEEMNSWTRTDISKLNNKCFQRYNNFENFKLNLLNLIEWAPKNKPNRFSLNYEQVVTELKIIRRNYDAESKLLKEYLHAHIQQFNNIYETLFALLNEIESRIREIPYKIEIIKNEQMRNPDQSSFINKISEIYKTFDEINAKCKNIMSLFTDILTNKKKKIEACCFNLESKKRRITELSNQCQNNWKIAMSTGGAALGAAGIGALGVAAGIGAVALAPFAIAAGLSYWAWHTWGKAKENDNEIKMDIKLLIEKSDKYGEDLIEAYAFLKVIIKESEIKDTCETSLEFLQRFLANVKENKKKIDDVFY